MEFIEKNERTINSRIISSIVFLFFITALSLNAQSLNGFRICIDPGHGGHDPANDRYMPQTGFWESDGNWSKANHIKPMLQDLGATVFITRTGNDDHHDISLSQRAAIANANNVDFFHSIHSNGFQGTSNYTLMLFKGTDNSPIFPQAKNMCNIMASKIYQANRTTSKYTRGDQSFLGFYLGVLRTLTMPGTLSEGSFHDYIPESWRLRNDFYRKHEARAITRAFLQYFNSAPATTGGVAGILRDPLENVSYYYISSTSDGKKPVNNIKVTLQPGNLVQNGDSFNNGFFFFDSLTPGQYKLYFEAEDYLKDSATVNVSANSTVFADKNMALVPNPNTPTVTGVLPLNGAAGISLKEEIEINFDIRMNRTKVQSAFSISPNVSGTFSWTNNDKDMKFTPSSNLQAGIEYVVKISTDAQTIFNVPLAGEYQTTFTTRSKLNLLSSYPTNNSIEISPSVQIILNFDAPINQQTLGGTIGLYDENGQAANVVVDVAAYQNKQIIFEPMNVLDNNKIYEVKMLSGIGDTEGLTLGEDITISFRIEKDGYTNGAIIEDFEEIGNWQNPDQSSTTIGTDPNTTNFVIASTRKVTGSKSGRLTYTFTGTNGAVRVNNSVPLDIGSDDNINFGIWVYGDLSGNEIEYWFTDAGSNNVEKLIDTLNWTGWKMKYIKIGDIGGTGAKKFHSIVVKQTENGNKTGMLFFDGVQSDVLTSVDGSDNMTITSYELFQNYPNPFNPSTIIKFNLPESGNVNVKVFDILGNEVATLFNGEKPSGSHSVEFNASKLASGVYFYKISAGSFVSVKKMMLLK